MPLVRGPFRGVLLIFHKDTNFNEFQKIQSKMTFQHPNFYKSTNDKHKCVIYYKNPYDAATVLDTYKENQNFRIYLYYDELSKSLRPDILFITGELTPRLDRILQQLKGTIIKQTTIGMQVKFAGFKEAAIAHEEMRKTHKVKFTYKSQVPHDGINEPRPETSKFSEPLAEERSETERRMNAMLQQYKELNLAMKNEFRNTIEKMKEKEKKTTLERIKEAASNLDFANVSTWNQMMNEEENVSEESESWETMARSSDEMLEMHKTYKEMLKRAEK